MWLKDPKIENVLVILAALLLARILVWIINRLVTRKIKDDQARYRTRKFVSFTGYFAVILFLLIFYRQILGGVAVALGGNRRRGSLCLAGSDSQCGRLVGYHFRKFLCSRRPHPGGNYPGGCD